MRIFIIIVCLLNVFVLCSQSADDYQRAQNGSLTLEECYVVFNNNIDLPILPSLSKHKAEAESADVFDAQSYFNIVTTMSRMLAARGDYGAMHKLMNDALRVVADRDTAKNSPHKYNLLIYKSQIEMLIQNFDAAVNDLHACESLLRSAGDYGESYIACMTNLSMAYSSKQDFVSSKAYMDEAVRVFEKLHGSLFENKSDEYFIIISNYGKVNLDIGNYDIAEKCFVYVLSNCKNTLVSGQAYQYAAINLSFLYYLQRRYKEAVQLLQNVNFISSQLSYTVAQNLAFMFLKAKKYKEALLVQAKLNELLKRNSINVFKQIPSPERGDYWSQFSEESLVLNNIIASTLKTGLCNEYAYNNLLFFRNLNSDADKLFLDACSSGNDTCLKRKINEYKQMRNELSYHVRDSAHYGALYNAVVMREQELLDSTPDLYSKLSTTSGTWKQVQEALDEDEIAIEFSNVVVNALSNNESYNYCAFVISKKIRIPCFRNACK